MSEVSNGIYFFIRPTGEGTENGMPMIEHAAAIFDQDLTITDHSNIKIAIHDPR